MFLACMYSFTVSLGTVVVVVVEETERVVPLWFIMTCRSALVYCIFSLF